MSKSHSDEFSNSLEAERQSIANLQARVQRLVARRTDTVPERKKEAEDLQRDVQTLAEGTSKESRSAKHSDGRK